MSENATQVVTGECRLSYVHLFEPWSGNPDQDKKYSTVLLIPKSDTKTYKKLLAAEKAAAEAGKERAFKGRIPKDLKSIIHDGDDTDKESPELEGHWFMTVSSKRKPTVVDRNLNEIIDPDKVYSGCYARAAINAYAYNVNGNRGVTFGLNHVQFLRDGEPLGGFSRAEDVFDALDDDDEDLV